MLTWRYRFTPPYGVTVRTLGAGDWLPEATLVPEAPQEYYTCCYPMALWGNTAVFHARDATGVQALHVYVRERGTWTKQTQPLRGSLGALEGRTLVTLERNGTDVTAVILERELGLWIERARITPGGGLGSIALEGDVLALGSDATQGVVRVFERNLGTWSQTAVLAASDGLPLGSSVAIEGRVVVAGTNPDVPRLARIYVFRLPNLARANAYGCGVNPEGSLRVVSGAPIVGGSLRLELDNPLATQAPGALVYLATSSRPDAHFPCGTRLAALGMDGGEGERLVPSTSEFTRFLGTWEGAPLQADLEIPADLRLVGQRLFLQGMLLDPQPGTSVPRGLTTGLELAIGAPSGP